MYLDLSAVTRNNGFQIPLAVVYFILCQRCIFGSECTYAEVAAAKPCEAVDNAKPAEEQCGMMRSQCCLKSGSNEDPSKCFKKTRPTDQSGDRGSCIKATILDKKEPPNEFLDGDVIVELKALSELQCWDYCLRHAQCKAYNYQKRGQNKPLKTCQLLSSEAGSRKSKEDFTFQDFEQNDSDRKATCVAEELSPRNKLIHFSFNKEYLEKRSQENADENNVEVIRRLWPFMNFLRPPEDVKNVCTST